METLKVKAWSRPGPSFDDWQEFKVEKGEAKIIELSHEYNYPTTDEREYLIIPLSVPVVVHYKGFSSYDYDEEWEGYYIFTCEGWKHVRVK